MIKLRHVLVSCSSSYFSVPGCSLYAAADSVNLAGPLPATGLLDCHDQCVAYAGCTNANYGFSASAFPDQCYLQGGNFDSITSVASSATTIASCPSNCYMLYMIAIYSRSIKNYQIAIPSKANNYCL